MVGKRIKKRRQALNMSADELAKRLNKNRATIYRYEKGEIENLPIDVLEPLATALKTTPQYLMGWSSEDDKTETTLVDVFKSSKLQHNLSLQEFLDELGILFKKFNTYEAGKLQIPSIEIMKLMTEFFSVDILESTDTKNMYTTLNDVKIKHFKDWSDKFSDIEFTDEEHDKMIEYANFLVHQRKVNSNG